MHGRQSHPSSAAQQSHWSLASRRHWQQARQATDPSMHGSIAAGQPQLHLNGMPLHSHLDAAPASGLPARHVPSARPAGLSGSAAAAGWQAPLSRLDNSRASPHDGATLPGQQAAAAGHDRQHLLADPSIGTPQPRPHLLGSLLHPSAHLPHDPMQTYPALDMHASPYAPSLDSPASLATPLHSLPEIPGDGMLSARPSTTPVWTEPDGDFEAFVGQFVRHRLGKYAAAGHPSRLEAEDTALLYRKLKVRIVDGERKVCSLHIPSICVVKLAMNASCHAFRV